MLNSSAEKPIIIPEQFSMLLKRQGMILQKVETLQEQLKTQAAESFDQIGDNAFLIHSVDAIQKGDMHRSMMELKSCNAILENYTLLTEYSSDTIEIGTKFQVLVKDSFGQEAFDFILIHKRIADEPVELFLSCESQLGINLKGKKVGDVIHYIGNDGKPVTANVLKIYKSRFIENPEEEKSKTK